MSKIVLASGNEHKIEELNKLLEDEPYQVLSKKDFDNLPEVVEDKDTLQGNALKKAREICQIVELPTLADDTGLEVDSLDGKPGVYSARFAGPEATDKDNNEKLLRLLADHEDVGQRTARFRTVIALVLPDGREKVVEGKCEGYILKEPRGEQGFGYDPLFYVEEYDATFAQLPMETKNKISHRGRAFRSIIKEIKELI